MRKRDIVIGVSLCFVIAAGMLAVAPQKTNALPGSEIEHFYLDANGNEVGHMFRDCHGNRFVEGVRSDRRVTHSESCNAGTTFGGCYVNAQQVSCSTVPFNGWCAGTNFFLYCQN